MQCQFSRIRYLKSSWRGSPRETTGLTRNGLHQLNYYNKIWTLPEKWKPYLCHCGEHGFHFTNELLVGHHNCLYCTGLWLDGFLADDRKDEMITVEPRYNERPISKMWSPFQGFLFFSCFTIALVKNFFITWFHCISVQTITIATRGPYSWRFPAHLHESLLSCFGRPNLLTATCISSISSKW